MINPLNLLNINKMKVKLKIITKFANIDVSQILMSCNDRPRINDVKKKKKRKEKKKNFIV